MSEKASSFAPAVQQSRLTLLRELAASLAHAQALLLASDLENFDNQIAWQQQLCEQLRSAHAWSLELNRGSAGSPPDDELGREIQSAGAQVLCNAQIYAAVLKRARRTVGIFCRVLANSGATYVAPDLPR